MMDKQKAFDDKYPYNAAGITAALEDYYLLKELGSYGHNPGVIDFMIDLGDALKSAELTDGQRKTIGLRYGLQLTPMEIQRYFNQTIAETMDHEGGAIATLDAYMNGVAPKAQIAYEKGDAVALSEHMLYVSTGKASPFDVPESVQTELLELTKHRDDLAKEVLRQRKEGKPFFKEELPLEKEYPSHKTSEYVESPTMKGTYYKKKHGYDYFREQDKNNGVSYDDFESYAKGLKVVGYKKTQPSTEANTNKKVVRF